MNPDSKQDVRPEAWIDLIRSLRPGSGKENGNAAQTIHFAAIPDRDLCGELFFFFDDRPELSHAYIFSNGRVAVERAEFLDVDTVRTDHQSYLDFFANRRSAQELVQNGLWSLAGRREGIAAFNSIAPFVRALESLLPPIYRIDDTLKREIERSASRLRAIRQVRRLLSCSPEEFDIEHARLGIPVIHEDLTSEWQPFDWSPDGLARHYDGRYAHFSYHPDCVYSISKCLRDIASGSRDAFKAVLPLTPELLKIYHLSYFRDSDVATKLRSLIVAPADHVMPPNYRATVWHRDWADNILVQLHGKKRVLLASPHFNECFYTKVAAACHKNVEVDYSEVNSRSPDPARFPNYGKADVLDVELEAGNALFIPCGWFHTVENLSASVAINSWRIRPPSLIGQ